MKLSKAMIGTLLFAAVGAAAFVWMVKRPAVDGNAMIFGMPTSSVATTEEKVEEKIPEATIPAANTSTTEASTPNTETEPTPVAEETTSVPATSDEPAPSETEIKKEEMPVTTTPESGETTLENTESTTN